MSFNDKEVKEKKLLKRNMIFFNNKYIYVMYDKNTNIGGTLHTTYDITFTCDILNTLIHDIINNENINIIKKFILDFAMKDKNDDNLKIIKFLNNYKYEKNIYTKYNDYIIPDYYVKYDLYKKFLDSVDNKILYEIISIIYLFHNTLKKNLKLINTDEKLEKYGIRLFDEKIVDPCYMCDTNGFKSENNLSIIGCVPDCVDCCELICVCCSFIKNIEEPWVICCYFCAIKQRNQRLIENIQKKISSHKNFDKKRFKIYGNITYDDVLLLLTKQNNKCYVCNDNLELINYDSNCQYQFSIDILNNEKPHDKDNVLISCYFCNCYNRSIVDTKKCKSCKINCHSIYKLVDKTRYDVSIDIINKFKLDK